MTGLLAIAKTGSASAVGLVIVIWFVVPYNVLALTEPPPIERIPVDARLAKLRTDVNNYLKEQQEPIHVQTTHGLSADEQRN